MKSREQPPPKVEDSDTEPEWEATESWQRDFVHYPASPVQPLDASFLIDTIGPGSEAGFREWPLPVLRLRSRAINGWVYNRLDMVGGEPPPALARYTFLAHLWRVVPTLRRAVRAFDRFVREGGFERNLEIWDEVWRPEAERRLAALRTFDLGSADDEELCRHLQAWREYMVWSWSPHIRVHLICFYVRGKFAEVCRRLLGLTELETYELVKRSDIGLLEAGNLIFDIARRALADQHVLELLGRPVGQALADLEETWFQKAVERFLDAHGDRPVDGFVLSSPTWRERPELIVALVKEFIDAPIDPEASEAAFQQKRLRRIDELRARLERATLEEFDRWLAYAERGYPLNDTHNYLLFELPAGLIRYGALEAGRRLSSAGLLDEPQDVFSLYLEEIVEALRGRTDAGELAALRRSEHRRNQTLVAPVFLGAEQLPPPFGVFPRAMAEAMEILYTQNLQMNGLRPQQVRPGQIVGNPGSPGIAEGPARVIHSVEQFDRVETGDVLVCPITGPAWTVVFPLLSALVTDSGGPLSHPAIVAREFGIPSVVGTGSSTARIKDGQRVRVDGTAGVVRLLDET